MTASLDFKCFGGRTLLRPRTDALRLVWATYPRCTPGACGIWWRMSEDWSKRLIPRRGFPMRPHSFHELCLKFRGERSRRTSTSILRKWSMESACFFGEIFVWHQIPRAMGGKFLWGDKIALFLSGNYCLAQSTACNRREISAGRQKQSDFTGTFLLEEDCRADFTTFLAGRFWAANRWMAEALSHSPAGK